MTALRAAIIGSGLMGRWHAQAVARTGNSIAAFADPELSRARALASRYSGAGAYHGLEEVLEELVVDVVHVCAPLPWHEELATAALHAGCHVLVEKPLAPDGEATVRLLRIAESRGRLLCPVHQFLFQRGVELAKRAVAGIGPLRHLEAVACSAGADQVVSEERDRIVADILPHPLSLVEAFLPAGSLDEIGWQVLHAAKGEVCVQGLAGDTTVSILVSMGGRPTRNSFRLIGERGSAHVDLFHGFGVLEGGRVSRVRKVTRPFTLAGATLRAATTNLALCALRREPAYPGLWDLVASFYGAVREGAPAPISPDSCLAVARARDALIASL